MAQAKVHHRDTMQDNDRIELQPLLLDVFPKPACTSKLEVDTLLPAGADSSTLEQARSLVSKRRASVERVSPDCTDKSAFDAVRDGMHVYAQAAYTAATTLRMQGDSERSKKKHRKVIALWSSPAYGVLHSTRYMSICWKEEAAISLFSYAAVHMQTASELLQDAHQSDPASDTAQLQGLRDALQHFRNAAGVFEFLEQFVKDEIAVRASASLSNPSPAEMQPAMCRAMSYCALAHCEALLAIRAEVKQMSAESVASLFHAAALQFDSSAAVLRKSSGDFDEFVDRRLLASLVCGKRFALARAYKTLSLKNAVHDNFSGALHSIEEAKLQVQHAEQCAKENGTWYQQFDSMMNELNQHENQLYDQYRLLSINTNHDEQVTLPEAKSVSKAIPFALHI